MSRLSFFHFKVLTILNGFRFIVFVFDTYASACSFGHYKDIKNGVHNWDLHENTIKNNTQIQEICKQYSFCGESLKSFS